MTFMTDDIEATVSRLNTDRLIIVGSAVVTMIGFGVLLWEVGLAFLSLV